MAERAPEPDLTHHGDREVGDGLVDLAVNVRGPAPRLAARPPGRRGRRPRRLPGRHRGDRRGRRAGTVAARREVLLTAGGAEAFTLLARALRPGHRRPARRRRPPAVHRAGGRAARRPATGCDRLLLRPEDGFRLDPGRVPDDADLVVLGNPTNPTSVLHPADVRPGAAAPRPHRRGRRGVHGRRARRAGVAGRRAGTPGLVVVRSLTKTWGLAGLRAGYLLARGRAGPSLPRPCSRPGRSPRWRPWRRSRAASRRPLAEAERAAASCRPTARTCVDRLAAAGTRTRSSRPRRRSCWCRCRTASRCDRRCGTTGSPSAAATPSPASGRTGCGSPSATEQVSDAFAACPGRRSWSRHDPRVVVCEPARCGSRRPGRGQAVMQRAERPVTDEPARLPARAAAAGPSGARGRRGHVALRRVAGLLESGADVHLVSPAGRGRAG